MKSFFALTHITSGFIAVLVGYSSSAAIIFQAASAAGSSPAELSSWLLALGLGMGVTSVGMSLYFRSPILTAWSTPGAALLATSLVGLPLAEAIGVFVFSSALITLCGLAGLFDRVMQRMPMAIAAAMLAGVLVRFGTGLFASLASQTGLVMLMLVTYFGGKRLFPRYAVPLSLASGLLLAALQGTIRFDALDLALARPIFTWPEFTVSSLLGVGLPLFIVTMASQNVPGFAVLRANGYATPASPVITCTGLTGLVLAPFGGFAFNLAAITAAICMSPDADPDPKRRYLAAVWAGLFYALTGIFGATVASLFIALPKELIAAIAGLALLGAIGSSLAAALADETEREAALVTFLATAAGFSLFGIGSAFWGLLLGLVVRHAQKH